jgi:hypothetical protein
MPANYDIYMAGQAGWWQIIIIILAILWLLGYLKISRSKKQNPSGNKITINNITIMNKERETNKKSDKTIEQDTFTDYEELK